MNPAAVGDQFPTFKRIGKRLFAISKPIGKGFLVLVIVLGGVYGILACVFTSQYRSEIAAVKARGEPLTPADLMGEEIPDAENAAIVYERIFSELAKEAVLKDLYTLEEFVHSDAAEKDAPTPDEARRALARSRKVLALLEEAASRPKCRFQLNWGDPTQRDFRHFSRLRSLMQLLRADAVINAQNGQMRDACHSINMELKLLKSLEDEPTLIAQLVQVALFGITKQSMNDALAYGDITEAQARQLFDALAEVDVPHGFMRCWQGERVYFLRISQMSDPPVTVRNTSPGGRGGVRIYHLPKPLGWLYGRTLFRGEQAAYLRFMARQIDGVNLSYKEAKSRRLFEEQQNLPFYATLSKTLAPVHARVAKQRYIFEAHVAQTQVVLALQAYKDRQGSYPATLDELRSRLGWELPKDPFSGKDLVYKRQDKRFLLYSIGPDLNDDGGKELDHYLIPTKPGDIVWKWER